MIKFPGPQIMGSDGRVRWAFMSTFDIPCVDPDSGESHLYLRRLRIIQTPWFGVYLHEMQAPDYDADLHDHPWSFFTIILKGGYTEFYKHRMRQHDDEKVIHRWNRWSAHFMDKLAGHRIVGLHEVPTYTLVFAGPRKREWGFWRTERNGQTWVPWHEYNEGRAV